VNLELEQNGPWPNKIWKASYDSWKKYFPEPEYRHFFWDDQDMNKFFKAKCAPHWESYTEERRDIVRADMARYCLLSRIGGIYADLDYEPRQNFFEQLVPGMVNLVQSPYQSESVQNSLMASPPGLPYWDKLLSIIDVRRLAEETEPNVLLAAGPCLLDMLPETRNDLMVNILPCNSFQRATHLIGGEEESAENKGCALLRKGQDEKNLMGIHWGTSVYAGSVADKSDIEILFDAFHHLKPRTPTEVEYLEH